MAKLILLTNNRLLPELIFEKTQIYYANFRILYVSIIFIITTDPKSSISTCFHVLVMFNIIPDDSGNFPKFSFSESQGQFFEVEKYLILNLHKSDCFQCLMISFSKHHINLLYLTQRPEFQKISNLFFNFEIWDPVPYISVLAWIFHHWPHKAENKKSASHHLK